MIHEQSNQNIHLLLPKKDLLLLKKRAKATKESVGELIRRAIQQVYGSVEPKKKLEAFERLSKRNELKMDDWDSIKKDLLKNRYD